tara:strand:+ start:933 stop:1151 length:219 start_codon:yes stop_codon:yes gene_type:complete
MGNCLSISRKVADEHLKKLEKMDSIQIENEELKKENEQLRNELESANTCSNNTIISLKRQLSSLSCSPVNSS